ncbi:MAG: hypothetical protein H7A23_12965 [Leptospiraceae bacterium]|nr:hypothetical protein [Leptospiraceae bacterium]MCP5495462.1 hypothetical protein [Leptospiraceae bacterium]
MECPLVIDDTTPSCGNSRLGCWTCTVIDQDKSMGYMILKEKLLKISRRCASLPILDSRSADEILGYDKQGLPNGN